jgi:pimeloyl-ACP methyl ester carboxylesterase
MNGEMHFIRRGSGPKILLVHGLGSSWRSWTPILNELAAKREVIAVDLPGFGNTPRLPGETSVATLSDALTDFLKSHNLLGIDAVGSSMGARLVLELARRGGILGSVVALDPGGFWRGWQRHAFYVSIYLSIRLIRLLSPFMRTITQSSIGRTLLLSQLSSQPWRLSPNLTLDEMRSYEKSPVFDELLYRLAYTEPVKGAPLNSIRSHLVIGWGRQDRLCFPDQAHRALSFYPDADLHWFEHSGHFPHWDAPENTVRLILASTAEAEDIALKQLKQEQKERPRDLEM